MGPHFSDESMDPMGLTLIPASSATGSATSAVSARSATSSAGSATGVHTKVIGTSMDLKALDAKGQTSHESDDFPWPKLSSLITLVVTSVDVWTEFKNMNLVGHFIDDLKVQAFGPHRMILNILENNMNLTYSEKMYIIIEAAVNLNIISLKFIPIYVFVEPLYSAEIAEKLHANLPVVIKLTSSSNPLDILFKTVNISALPFESLLFPCTIQNDLCGL